MNKLINKNNIIDLLTILIMTFASFDIAGTFEFSGMTIRIAWVFIFIEFILLMIFHSSKLKLPIGHKSLILFILLQFVFIFNSQNIKFSIGYFGWLILDVMIIFIFQNVYNSTERIQKLLKYFIVAFDVAAFIGLLQIILWIFGINFYILDSFTLGSVSLPRVLGFSFEPSYYATFLIPGWIILFYLIENGSSTLNFKFMIASFVMMTIPLIFSNSRMGWLCMILFSIIVFIKNICDFFRKKATKTQIYTIFIIIIAFVILLVLLMYFIKTGYAEKIFSGVGLFGAVPHSMNTRIRQFKYTLSLFFDSPFIGTSLGGVAAAYCNKFNLKFDSGAAMCVWVELLVASGIIGIIPFITWFYNLIKGLIKTIKSKSIFKNESIALLFGLIFECFLLAMNQNILRIYFWTLIAVINAVAYNHQSNSDIEEDNKKDQING